MYGYIYESIDKRNGMLYIGQRKGQFKPDYHGSGLRIKRIISKCAEDVFTTRLIDQAGSKEELDKKEKSHIAAYRMTYGEHKLYNLSDGGDGGALFAGRKHSEKTKEEMRKVRKGKTHSEEVKERMRKPHGTFSEEAKINMSKAHLGNRHSEESKAKISKAFLGIKKKPLSEETKAKLRKANLGKRLSKETIAKMKLNRVGMTGKHHSEETKAKISKTKLERSNNIVLSRQ